MFSIVGRQLKSRLVRGGGGHYKGYNEPTGHFLGIPPAPPGYRRKKLQFENIWTYLYGGTTVMFFVFMYYRPESEIHAWAREEAARRIEARGENWTDKNF